jgi:2-polyprenyl-6-methoxyphenol hydroxylase-like FAD-dependent oxidoreductase
MATGYDAIVVGARCAGAPTAMLLARRGHRVLLVDRTTFPSDTLSTHVVHPRAAAALRRWGLLDRLISTGCPAIHTYAFDFGPVVIDGSPGTDADPIAFCPRRLVLDKLLVDAAAEAGVEVREGITVDELTADGDRIVGIKGHAKGGAVVRERATVVIGADGRNSIVAEAVEAEKYHERPPLLAPYYSYWSNLPMRGRFETYVRPARGFAAAETHDGLTMVVGGWPYREFGANKSDLERNYVALFDTAPTFAERVRGAKREARILGAPTPNYFRKPYGPGWVLVGDAGYLKDPITAQGILDAFRDAERCTQAIDEALRGAKPFDEALASYQDDRDRDALPMYEFTCQLAPLDPPPPEMQQLFGAINGNRSAMDDFVRMNAGTISPARFFAPENVGAIYGAAARGAA